MFLCPKFNRQSWVTLLQLFFSVYEGLNQTNYIFHHIRIQKFVCLKEKFIWFKQIFTLMFNGKCVQDYSTNYNETEKDWYNYEDLTVPSEALRLVISVHALFFSKYY